MLVIVSTHPIQYQTPIWQALARDGRVPFEVWYMTDFGLKAERDPEFGTAFRWDIDTTSGYPHRILKAVPGAAPANVWKCRMAEDMRDALQKAGATVVMIQGWQVAGYWQTAFAAKAMGAKLWLRGESNDLAPTPAWKKFIKKIVLGRLFAMVDHFFTIGSGNKRLYRSFGVPESKMSSAPYAVDIQRFAGQAAALRGQRQDLRRAWGIADDAFCVLFCGKFIHKKRPLDLVRAAAMVRQDGRVSNIHLLFVGAGDLDAELHEACNVVFDKGALTGAGDDPAKPKASFAGFLNQTEISRAYVAADCMVLPSDHGETWGLVVNEAMASGIPCIVSDACGSAEDLAGPAWSFPLGDTTALAERLARMQAAPVKPGMPKSFEDSVNALVAEYLKLDAGAQPGHG